MTNKLVKTYTLAEMKDKYIGNIGTQERDEYEYELRMDILGKMIKAARQERHLSTNDRLFVSSFDSACLTARQAGSGGHRIGLITCVLKRINFDLTRMSH